MTNNNERTKVTTHMIVSIDGKINGKYEDEPLTETVFGHYYETLFEEFGTAMGVGNKTNVETMEKMGSQPVDFSKYVDVEVTYDDFIVQNPNGHYYVSFDRKGTCTWPTNHFEHLGKKLTYLQVLTKAVKKEYLAYLRDMNIPYIFAGEADGEMDLTLATSKLKTEFGIENLVVCGGAIINGAFFDADLVDEISLVVSPYMEGDKEMKTFAEINGAFKNTTYPLKYAKPIDGGGVHLVYTKEK